MKGSNFIGQSCALINPSFRRPNQHVKISSQVSQLAESKVTTFWGSDKKLISSYLNSSEAQSLYMLKILPSQYMVVDNFPSNPSNICPQSLQFSHLWTNSVRAQISEHIFLNCFEWITDFFAIINSGYVVIDLLPSKFWQRKSSFLGNGAIQ